MDYLKIIFEGWKDFNKRSRLADYIFWEYIEVKERYKDYFFEDCLEQINKIKQIIYNRYNDHLVFHNKWIQEVKDRTIDVDEIELKKCFCEDDYYEMELRRLEMSKMSQDLYTFIETVYDFSDLPIGHVDMKDILNIEKSIRLAKERVSQDNTECGIGEVDGIKEEREEGKEESITIEIVGMAFRALSEDELERAFYNSKDLVRFKEILIAFFDNEEYVLPNRLLFSNLKHTTWEKLLRTIYKKLIPEKNRLPNDKKFIEIAKCISSLNGYDISVLGPKLNKASNLF